jgi:hypothetical protein
MPTAASVTRGVLWRLFIGVFQSGFFHLITVTRPVFLLTGDRSSSILISYRLSRGEV